MTWIIVAVVIIAVLVVAVLKLAQQPETNDAEFPYIKQAVLFTPAERSFLGVLTQAVDDNTQIFGKVRVADIITTKKGMSASDRQRAFNKISGKHFDFILCNKHDLSVKGAIELNDSSHNSKKRRERDNFLEGACKASGTPLIQIAAKAAYTVNEIKQSLETGISGSVAKEPELDIGLHYVNKICPKCSSNLIKKMATKGKNAGNEFWACSSFPQCRHSESI